MCDHPLQGWRSRERTATGKRSIVFNVRDGLVDFPVTLPCGKCDGCLLERSRQWAVRIMHEASLYDSPCACCNPSRIHGNSFVTLTYDDDHLPAGGSLDRSAWRLFMDRLRKEFGYGRVRYFHCGEYGTLTRRPHYHGILFNCAFPDAELFTVRNGMPVYRSKVLEVLWPFGLSEIGSVTFASASYVARYVTKKIGRSGSYDGREKEYATMSRRPGIGRRWFDKYRCEVYPADSVVVRGKLMKPPRLYDVWLEQEARAQAAVVRARREAQVKPEEQRGSRLLARRSVRDAMLNLRGERGL